MFIIVFVVRLDSSYNLKYGAIIICPRVSELCEIQYK